MDKPPDSNIGMPSVQPTTPPPHPLDSIMKTANNMTSMMMAHKIALEDDFRLEPGLDITGPLMSISPILGSSPTQGFYSGPQTPEAVLQNKVTNIVHDAYWDLFKEEIATQNNEDVNERRYEISKQILRDLKQKIIDLLLPQHIKLKQEIDDKLDPEIVDQLCNVHSLDLNYYGKYILEVLSKLCAPVRDEKLKELENTRNIVTLYRGIMELTELMKLDFANFTINRFKPHIKAHSHDYEREKFNEILKQQEQIGIDGLEYTRLWLNRAVARVDSLYGLRELLNDTSKEDNQIDNQELDSSLIASTSELSSSSKAAYVSLEQKISNSDIINKVLNNAYCELLEWSPNLQKMYPETLILDEATFKQLGEQVRLLIMTSSVLLTTFAFMNRFKIGDDSDFRTTIKSHVVTLLTATYDEPRQNNNLDQTKLETIVVQLIDDIKKRLQNHNELLVKEFEKQKDLFTRQVFDIQNSSNRIRELSRRRIFEFVETLLAIDAKHQHNKSASRNAPPVNLPLGLNCLADEITLTMAQVVKIIRYNRKVFIQRYQDIIIDLVRKAI